MPKMKYRAWFKHDYREFSLDFCSNDKWTKDIHPSRVIRVELIKNGQVVETWNVNENPDFNY